MPPFSTSETEITKALPQHSSVMICVLEFVAIVKSLLINLCLRYDTQSGDIKISTLSTVQGIIMQFCIS